MPRLEAGDRVTILRGPYAMCAGLVVECSDDVARVIVYERGYFFVVKCTTDLRLQDLERLANAA